MKNRLFWLIVLFVSAAMLLAACGGSSEPATVEAPAEAPAAEEQAVEPTEEEVMEEEAAPTEEEAMEEEAAPTEEEAMEDEAMAGDTELTILWFAWQPCEALGELSSQYEGAKVTVNCVPIGEWYNTTFTDFAAQGGADLVVMDSQWIGEAVTGGHVMDLTDFMAANIEVDDYVPAALSAYGEYPAGTKKYYGVAIEGDTQMLVYRKDLFEEAGFAPPATWTELLEQAQTFKEGDLVENGYATFWCGAVACYDQVATVWNQMAWSFGGELWDSSTYQVEGILNSEENLAALEFAQELFKTGPDGAANFTFDETVGAICSGSIAMTTIWFGFGPAFLDSEGCAQADNLAFGIVPGETEHVISLGGMGISVSSYTQHADAALEYVKWVQTEEAQLEWAKLGGFSARESVLASDTFINATPYNAAFSESYLKVRDFWNVPEYAALLEPQMEFLNLAISGQMDAAEALDEIAIQQQEIFDEAYPDGPPAGVAAMDDGEAMASDAELTILWFAWQPCEALGELSAQYSGASVTVNCVPIGEWYNTTFTDFAAQGGADLVVMDSQWIGEAVTGGHVQDLSSFMAANIEVDDYVPAALSAYGEYPPNSQQYYGVAIEGDTQMLVYRKDLFEEAGFAPPATWTELLEQAQTFKEGDLVENGYATFWCGAVACYDQVATVWNQMAWSFGGELWDSETYQIDGVLNSEENLAALEFAQELFKTGPDGAANFTFDETVGSICSGSIAMTTIWFGFGPAFLDSEGCAQADNLAFAIVPGEVEHVISLGGMGISVSSYTDNTDAALDYIKWVQTEETQLEWAKLGGFSARESVLSSDTFINATPYNAAFSESYLNVRDFWNIPEYAALLEPQMEFLNLAISGQMDAAEALDEIAIQQQEIIDDAYPDGPPSN